MGVQYGEVVHDCVGISFLEPKVRYMRPHAILEVQYGNYCTLCVLQNAMGTISHSLVHPTGNFGAVSTSWWMQSEGETNTGVPF